MSVSRETLVIEAVKSSPEAPALFEAHGVCPCDECKGMYDMISLDEAEDWCKLRDVDGLIAELNAALAKQTASVSGR